MVDLEKIDGGAPDVAPPASPPILVCVPFLRPHIQFLPHFIEWYAANKARHNLRLHFKMYKALHEVQSQAVLAAQGIGASHILFIEDDHWKFPVDGLDELLSQDKDVIGFQTVRRSPPFRSLAMKKRDPSLSMIERHRNLDPHERGDGPEIQPTDVLTWAFTLVKTSVFERLHKAGKVPFNQWGPVPTDSFFNQYCEDLGIERFVHFGWTIAHGDHDPDDLDILREAYQRIEVRKQRQCRPFKTMTQMADELPSADEIAQMVNQFHANREVAA